MSWSAKKWPSNARIDADPVEKGGLRMYRLRSQGRGFVWLSLVLMFMLLFFVQSSLAAEEKPVTEEILEIMRSEGQITEEQYKELKEKARKEQEEDESTFRLYWQDGVRLDSKDDKFKIKFGGRIFLDWTFIDTDDKLDRTRPGLQGHGVEIRSARLYSEGTIYDALQYKLEYDFAGGDSGEGGDPTAEDVWIGLTKIPYVGDIRFGHMKEPFSLDELTNGSHITFMERALPVEAFAPGRNTGVQLLNSALDDRITWKVGAFQDTDDFGYGFSDSSDYDITARVTGLPWYADNGRKLLHLGLSYSHQFRSSDNQIRLASRPEAHNTSDETVDTGDFDADDVDLFAPELALVFGPFSVQTEYFHIPIKSDSGGDPTYDGFYINVSGFVTGEHRNYDAKEGYFGRVLPKKNFHPTQPGWGAVELAARISELDTNGGDVRGGKELNFTFGLNWYLNPNTRLMFNYVHASVDDRIDGANGDMNIFQARIQIDF